MIYWKAGFRQEVTIHRKTNRRLVDRLWTEQEMRLLKQLFPDAAKEVLTTSLPGRTWKSITLKAIDLNIKRQRNMKLTEPKPENSEPHRSRDGFGCRSESQYRRVRGKYPQPYTPSITFFREKQRDLPSMDLFWGVFQD